MKKILIILLITFYSLFISDLGYAENHKRYLFRNSFYCYDVDTFKYNPKNNTYSINIIYDIHPFKSDNITKNKISENKNNIEFIILNIKYNPSTKLYKTEYKGYVKGNWHLEGMTFLFTDSKMYYRNNHKILPYYKQISKDFKQYASLAAEEHYINFPKDIYEIHTAAKNNSLQQIEDLHSSINYEDSN